MTRFARPLVTTTLALACLAALPTFVHAQAAAAPAPAAGAQKIGSVNLQRVFNEVKESKQVEATLRAKQTAAQTDAQTKQAHLKELQGQRDQFKAGSPDYDRANAALSQANVEAVVTTQVAQQDLVREQKRLTRGVVDKIAATVKTLATEKGFTLVLTQTVPPELSDDQTDRLTMEQFNQLLSQRNILYVNPDSDLTTEVIARMDAAFAGQK